MKKLNNRFSGKICTVMTGGINRDFNEYQAREHFVIVLEEVTEEGVWGRHPVNDTFSFFAWQHIIAIFEELVVPLDKTEKPPEVKKEEEGSSFVDIRALSELAARTKKSYDSIKK